jgi:DNA-binding response OmpR family regulator
MRIAVISSDYALIQLVRLILEDEGHDLYAFSDLSDAAVWLEKEPVIPDIIFFELMFPLVEKSDIYALLKKPRYNSIYKVLISIIAPKRNNALIWDRFLKSPFTIKQFLNIIQNCVFNKNKIQKES